VAVLPFRLGGLTTAFAALGLLQIGEFSYLLAQTGRAFGAISDELNSLILTSSVVTIVLTPLAFRVAPWVGNWLARLPLVGERVGALASAHGDDRVLARHLGVVGSEGAGGSAADR
jgi:K+:H+ antiporter